MKRRREEKCQRYKARSRLLVDLIKGSGVVEAAVPDLIDDSSSVGVVLAARSVCDRQCSSPSYTLLKLLCDVPLATSEELATKAALSRQCGCADLGTRSDGVADTVL